MNARRKHVSSTNNPDEFSGCEESNQLLDHGKSLRPIEKTDAAIRGLVDRAIWNDDVLRAIEYSEIVVHVRNGVVYLSGHIASTISQNRIRNAIRAIPGVLGIQNNLVLDEKLTLEVARSLGELEYTYDCKFFTGASHGVISLNGVVNDENVKSLAAGCASSKPNLRGVINNVRVSGTETALQDQPFLQPHIGATIYFLDGVSGVVKQLIINPNNRRVVAMTGWGQFADLKKATHDEHRDLCMESAQVYDTGKPEHLVFAARKGNEMIQLNLNTDIYRPLEQVFAFVTAPENDFYWQYGTLMSDKISKGDMGVETLFRTVAHFMGRRIESVYEVTEFKPNQNYGFKSQSGPIALYTLYTFEIVKGSTRISNSTQISLGEPFKSNPMRAEKTVRKEYRENLSLLKDILESSRAELPAERTLLASHRQKPDLR